MRVSDGRTNERRKRRRMPGLDRFLVFSFTVIIVYDITEFVVSSITGMTHDTLTTCIHSVFGGELLLCAFIKKYKIKQGGE